MSSLGETLRELSGILEKHDAIQSFTGSRVTGGALPDSDYDVIVYVEYDKVTRLYNDLVQTGYVDGGSDIPVEDGAFYSLKLHDFGVPDINVIIVWDTDQYGRWTMATNVAAGMMLVDKKVRCLLFELLRTQHNDTSLSESEGKKAATVGSGSAPF